MYLNPQGAYHTRVPGHTETGNSWGHKRMPIAGLEPASPKAAAIRFVTGLLPSWVSIDVFVVYITAPYRHSKFTVNVLLTVVYGTAPTTRQAQTNVYLRESIAEFWRGQPGSVIERPDLFFI